jgi:hypothetical protein
LRKAIDILKFSRDIYVDQFSEEIIRDYSTMESLEGANLKV